MQFRVVIMFIVFTLSLMSFAAQVPSPDRIDEIAQWLPDKPQGLGKPISDRAAWGKVSQHQAWKDVAKKGETLLEREMPQIDDQLYLDFSRTGNRSRYQRKYFDLEDRLSGLVLAECVENKGRFLPEIEKILNYYCTHKSWALPAHDRNLDCFEGRSQVIDLFASNLGWVFATTDYLLGDKISLSTRKNVRKNINRRILIPIRKQINGEIKQHWWFKTTNNWNAVCLCNVTGTALAMIEDPKERALYVGTAEHYIGNFLNGFAADGYCTEGVGYWNYGFGRFLLLSELLWQATNGKINLLKDPKAQLPAEYGMIIKITDSVCPTFSDCSIGTMPSKKWLHYISRHLNLRSDTIPDDLVSTRGDLPEIVMSAFENSTTKIPHCTSSKNSKLPIRTWFDKAGVLICRPGDHSDCRMAAAMKGGNNAEHHNHNDVGSYLVVVDDKLILADPGAEVYTARTFSSRRYESKAINSYGHPVPVVAGKLQKTGHKAQGKILQADFSDTLDLLEVDYTSAYDVPELKTLTRTFEYIRQKAGMFNVADRVEFTKPQTFETALITFGNVKKLSSDLVEVSVGDTKVHCKITCEDMPFMIKTETIDEDFRTKTKPTRIGIRLEKPVQFAEVSILITPIQ